MAYGGNREHGPYRRPVGGSGTVVSSQTTSRWARARATVAGHACGAERGLLGSTHRCSLARSAVSLSVLSNLPSAFPILAAQRAADALAAKTSRRFTRPRKARSERILHRHQLQRREKRGCSVGPTKRGKGSKIMAIADGHGFPLSVYVASASGQDRVLASHNNIVLVYLPSKVKAGTQTNCCVPVPTSRGRHCQRVCKRIRCNNQLSASRSLCFEKSISRPRSLRTPSRTPA